MIMNALKNGIVSARDPVECVSFQVIKTVIGPQYAAFVLSALWVWKNFRNRIKKQIHDQKLIAHCPAQF